ncbi:MAG: hypothetical protein HQ513_07490 [Rhodospirillales bacterium]|nr:hypothetical protein [Rhodospirillales bacterium]
MDKGRPFCHRLFVVMLTGLLSACAAKPVVWQKPNTQEDVQRAALAQCRSYASAEADRDFERQQSYTGSASSGGQSTYQKNMTAYQAGKSRDDLLSRCMKLKGYRQIPATN